MIQDGDDVKCSLGNKLRRGANWIPFQGGQKFAQVKERERKKEKKSEEIPLRLGMNYRREKGNVKSYYHNNVI